MSFWMRSFGHGGSWRSVMRLTRRYNYDASSWTDGILRLLLHNYDYLSFRFADHHGTDWNFNTPSHFIKPYYYWFFITISADYINGKYSAFVFDNL